MSHFTEAELKHVFDKHDSNHSGKITKAEAHKAYDELGEHKNKSEDFEHLFQKHHHGDQITFDDFKHFAHLEH